EEWTPYLHLAQNQRTQRLYPVVEETGRLVGVVTKSNMQRLLEQSSDDASNGNRQLAAIVEANPVVAYPDEPLRVVVYRMAETGLTRLPVVERSGTRKLLGMISLYDLLTARVRNLEAERRRERGLPLPRVFPQRASRLVRRAQRGRVRERSSLRSNH